MTLTIRPWTPADNDACIEILRSNVGPYIAAHEVKDYVHFLENDAANENYHVVLKDGSIVACGGFADDGTSIVFAWGLVNRELHGTGIGTRLVKFRLDAIRRLYPDRPIRLDTSQFTRAFYERFGFEAIETIPNGYAEGFDKINMILRNAEAST